MQYDDTHPSTADEQKYLADLLGLEPDAPEINDGEPTTAPEDPERPF